MAVVFDATVGGASANSYTSIADYNQYRENIGLATLANDTAEVALIVATTWAEDYYRNCWLTQDKVATTQALHWPQSGALYNDGSAILETVIPDQVKRACYEYAIARTSESQTSVAPVGNTNVKMEKLEGLGETEYFSKTSSSTLPDAYQYINTILTGLIRAKSGASIYSLYRY